MDNLLKERVLDLCEKRGITVNKLEKLAELSPGSIKHWDKHMPSVDKVYRVAEVLNTTVDYLMGYVGDPDVDMKHLMDTVTWLSKEDIAALIAVAEQLKGK